MPRRARMYIAGLPHHVVQRGNNRDACFIEPDNYRFYLDLWGEHSRRFELAVHAYCLMTNHVDFLVTPGRERAVSDTMKIVGSHYAQYINRKYRRTGTLWEGWHRASLVQSERYLLTCMHYIELNPVRAGMVKRPEEYRWSSYGANAWGGRTWLTGHAEYVRLGPTWPERCRAYRKRFETALSEGDLQYVRKAAHYCQPVGDDRFRQHIEKKYGIKLGQMRRGRPAKEGSETQGE